jgi:hypothetical protein
MPILPRAGDIAQSEGIIETDHWFGALFVNLRFTYSHTSVRIRHAIPWRSFSRCGGTATAPRRSTG